jgi:hypothetical protein
LKFSPTKIFEGLISYAEQSEDKEKIFNEAILSINLKKLGININKIRL